MNFDYSILKNPEIFFQNKMAAHSDHEFYQNEAQMKSKESGFFHSLSGVWKFSYAVNLDAAPKGFER